MIEEKSARELHDEWEKAKADLEELRARYFTTGSSLPVKYPPENATPEALEEIEALERKVDELWTAYKEKIGA
jgi:hypothetical protein